MDPRGASSQLKRRLLLTLLLAALQAVARMNIENCLQEVARIDIEN